MSDALTTRASKIRRFGPLASAGNRNLSSSSKDVSLGAEIQRSLLHVGMRVRKSVTGGYRTSLKELELSKSSEQQQPCVSSDSSKKRQLDDATRNAPLEPKTSDALSGRPSGPRQFAVPKTRKLRPALVPEPMELDLMRFADENGDFAEADFLVPE